MKIGILTFHRAHNYGAVLQAYALQESIRKLGHDVVIIDYRQPYNEQVYAVDFEWRLFFRNLIHLKRRKVFNYIKDKHFKLHRSLIFWKFRKEYLNIEIKKDGGFPRCDRYIVGSDQVWSFHCTNGYDPILWGEFPRPNESKLYGFSISSNGDFFNYMTNEKIVSRMEAFTDISFRESSISELILAKTGIRKQITLDPTILTKASDWEKLIDRKWSKKDYIVIYNIRNFTNMPYFYELANRIIKDTKIEIIDLSLMDYSVVDFVSAIKYARCVLTSSFHATVFSVIMDTPFYSVKFNDGHDGRYVDFLSSLKLEEHIISLNTEKDEILKFDVDQILINLEELKKESINYLSKVVS